jgi:glutamate-1-semialdehyde 2,1-aminomutase
LNIFKEKPRLNFGQDNLNIEGRMQQNDQNKFQDSYELFKTSLNFVPGGVHSPVRSFKGLDRTPVFFDRAKGAYIHDVEGKNYIDFCMSFGPLILGHQDSDVKNDLIEALGRGWSYGACEPYSLALATFLIERLPFIEKIRFVSSGTEAVMTALRLARGVTKRNKILKFDGCYHGHVDSMLIKAGSGLAGEAESSSAGVSSQVASETLIIELDNEEAVKKVFEEHRDIAAIIIEPLPANNGLMPQRKEFLQFLREITKKHGALLIFDEVISGFRVGFGGMAELTGISPDIVTYGKVIGGGLPVGAIAAKSYIMDHLAPLGPVYQAGTLSANPLAMVAGLSTLNKLSKDTYQKIDVQSLMFTDLLSFWLKKNHYEHVELTSFTSLFWINRKKNPRKISELPKTMMEDFIPLFRDLLSAGIYLAPNPYEVGFCSLAHDQEVLSEMKKRLKI